MSSFRPAKAHVLLVLFKLLNGVTQTKQNSKLKLGTCPPASPRRETTTEKINIGPAVDQT